MTQKALDESDQEAGSGPGPGQPAAALPTPSSGAQELISEEVRHSIFPSLFGELEAALRTEVTEEEQFALMNDLNFELAGEKQVLAHVRHKESAEEARHVRAQYQERESLVQDYHLKKAVAQAEARKAALQDKLALFNSEIFTKLTRIVIEQELLDHQAQSRVDALMATQRDWVLAVISDIEKCSQVARVRLQQEDQSSSHNDETLRQLYTLKVLRKSLELGCLSFCALEEKHELDNTLSKKLIGVLKKSHHQQQHEGPAPAPAPPPDIQIQKLVEIKASPSSINAAGQKKIIELAQERTTMPSNRALFDGLQPPRLSRESC